MGWVVISIVSFIYSYSISSCLEENNKKDIKKMIVTFAVFIITNFLVLNSSKKICIYMLTTHVISLLGLCIVYRKRIEEFIVSYSLIYYFYNIYLIVIILSFGHNMSGFQGREVLIIPLIMLIVIYVINMKSIIKIYTRIMQEKHYMNMLIIVSFILDFVLIFHLVIYRKEHIKTDSIILILLMLFLISIIVYFYNIYRKSKVIFDLNKELEAKNDELKDIKDSHGKVILHMYYLYRQQSKEEIGLVLKNIINGKDDKIQELICDKKVEEKSLLSIALRDAIDMGIDVSVEEKCSISLANIDEMGLYRILCNIVNNAIKAMNGKGKINARTYKKSDNIIIDIENNGPKIKDEDIEKIFESGFTTKNNKDNSHGYGLSIVKELIENNNGEIKVESTDLYTVFKIQLPVK